MLKTHPQIVVFLHFNCFLTSKMNYSYEKIIFYGFFVTHVFPFLFYSRKLLFTVLLGLHCPIPDTSATNIFLCIL